MAWLREKCAVGIQPKVKPTMPRRASRSPNDISKAATATKPFGRFNRAKTVTKSAIKKGKTHVRLCEHTKGERAGQPTGNFMVYFACKAEYANQVILRLSVARLMEDAQCARPSCPLPVASLTTFLCASGTRRPWRRSPCGCLPHSSCRI